MNAPPLDRDALLCAGIDVGGTKTALVVTDADDHEVLAQRDPTQRDRLGDQIVGLLRAAQAQLALDGRTIAAVGICLPGHVDPSGGKVRLAVNLGAPEIALSPLVESALGLPCYIEHDARAAATWLVRGEADECRSLAYLAIGTGIAAGIILDGQPLRGDNGLAGEIGHVLADPAGPLCPCGLRGCLETVAAGPAIARQAREALAAGRSSSLTPEATAAQVFLAASAGDELATEIVGRVAGHLARAIRALVLALGVKRVVIGGGVAAAGDALLAPIRATIDRERAMSALVDAIFEQARLELLSPDLDAGARGVAAIARQRLSAPPREGVRNR